ncbi:EAL domain-containing protein [Hydrogenimonas urashimensis]|uniref:EAL domain-containing protein n=1 Tax=Hydrogenimonas urashimensis TaxID=2740515 RepID=UPI0019169F8C|nr:EAL domain-containing protein [Hydrogenimonas urashimensis]
MTAKKNRFVLLFASISFLALLYNAIFIYDQFRRIDNIQLFVSTQQAKILDAFFVAFRTTYQESFLKNHIPLNEENIKLLPVVTTPKISEKIAEIIANKAIVRTVSDRPRNPKNAANELERRTLDYFRKHPGQKKTYATIKRGGEEFFFFAAPLYITKQCLKCHGKREDAPEYIRTHYNSAYGYKEGDLRGLISIYLDQKGLHENVMGLVYKNISLMLVITFLFLTVFFFLMKKIYLKEEEYTSKLEKEVERQTQALEKKSQELEYQLYHDRLTQLPNRNALINDIADPNARALILLNIDDFKEINDFYGHEAGDTLIKKLAELLHDECPRKICTLYRMPSDEFALLLYADIKKETLERHIKELIRKINNFDFVIDSNVVHLRIAAGASMEIDDLLVTADMAIKKAKAERADYIIYDPSMNMSHFYKKNIEWAERLKSALEEDRIVPYFQPIVSARDGRVKIYESLVRLLDEDGTVHTPYHFLEIAKRTKYYPELTKRMADKIFDISKKIPCDISMNISYLDIMNKQTMDYIIRKVSESDNAHRFHFEILESEGIERYEDVSSCLKRLRKLGCQISVDDFGSGYSNFDHILKLEVDMLKIDGSLIKNINNDIGSQIIVETIVDFAEKLRIETCAEFVCSKEVYETVKDIGVTYVQGYYIGEPKPDIPDTTHYEI